MRKMKVKIWAFAVSESASHCAPGPPAAAMSAKVCVPEIAHGKQTPSDCTVKPTNAAIATRPCLISAWRNQAMNSSSVNGRMPFSSANAWFSPICSGFQ